MSSTHSLRIPVGGRLRRLKIAWIEEPLELEEPLTIPAGNYWIGVNAEDGAVLLINRDTKKRFKGKLKDWR